MLRNKFYPFKKEDVGKWGYTCSKPNSNSKSRTLVGPLNTKEEVEKLIKERRKNISYPKIVKWSKKVYDNADYVFPAYFS